MADIDIKKFQIGDVLTITNNKISKLKRGDKEEYEEKQIHICLIRLILISQKKDQFALQGKFKVRNVNNFESTLQLEKNKKFYKAFQLEKLIESVDACLNIKDSTSQDFKVSENTLYFEMYSLFEIFIQTCVDEEENKKSVVLNLFQNLGIDINIKVSCFHFVFHHVLEWIQLTKLLGKKTNMVIYNEEEFLWRCDEGMIIIPELYEICKDSYFNIEQDLSFTLKEEDDIEKLHPNSQNKILTSKPITNHVVANKLDIEYYEEKNNFCELIHEGANENILYARSFSRISNINLSPSKACFCENCSTIPNNKSKHHIRIAKIALHDDIDNSNRNRVFTHDDEILQDLGLNLNENSEYYIDDDNYLFILLKNNSTVDLRFLSFNPVKFTILQQQVNPSLSMSIYNNTPVFHFIKRTQKYMQRSFLHEKGSQYSSHHKYENLLYVWTLIEDDGGDFKMIIDDDDFYFDGKFLYFIDPSLERVTLNINGENFYFKKMTITESPEYHILPNQLFLRKTKFAEGSNSSSFSSCFNNAIL